MVSIGSLHELLFIYFFTFVIEPIFRNVNYISSTSKYGIIFYILPSNTTWFIHHSILLQTCLFILIFAPLLVNNQRSIHFIGLKFLNLIPIFIDIVDLLSIYDKYSMNSINYAFSFCLLRLASKLHLVSRNYSSDQSIKQALRSFDFTQLIFIQTVFLQHSLTNLFDVIRRLILYTIIDLSNDELNLKPNEKDLEKYSYKVQITQQEFSKVSIILLFLIVHWKSFSIISLISSGIILFLICYDTKLCLNEFLKSYDPRTCSVCLNKKNWYEFKDVIIISCQHKTRSVCNQCLLQHVRIIFEQTNQDDIFCPEKDCGIRFDYHTVINIFSFAIDKQSLINKYELCVLNQKLQQMNGFIWCSNSSCGIGQLSECFGLNTIITCFYCQQRICFTHRIGWHEGMTCEEYDKDCAPIDKLTSEWIASNSKKCPKCPWQIEKNEGCDHMTCKKCKHEFCWLCLADYEPIRREGKHRHRDNCKHYVRAT